MQSAACPLHVRSPAEPPALPASCSGAPPQAQSLLGHWDRAEPRPVCGAKVGRGGMPVQLGAALSCSCALFPEPACRHGAVAGTTDSKPRTPSVLNGPTGQSPAHSLWGWGSQSSCPSAPRPWVCACGAPASAPLSCLPLLSLQGPVIILSQCPQLPHVGHLHTGRGILGLQAAGGIACMKATMGRRSRDWHRCPQQVPTPLTLFWCLDTQWF